MLSQEKRGERLQTTTTVPQTSKTMMDSLFTVDFQYNLAKATTWLCVVYGLVGVLAPQKLRHVYTKQKPELKDPEVTWKVIDYIEQIGSLCILSCGLTWWLHAMEGLSRDNAIGVASLLWLVHTLNALLNEVPKQVKSSPRSSYINLVVFGGAAYATLGGTQLSNLATKILSCFGLANGFLLFANPNAMETLYNMPDRESYAMFCRRLMGNNLFSFSIFVCGLSWDLPHFQACGLSWASVGIGLVLLLPECQKHNVRLERIMAWIVLMAFCAVVFLAGVPEEQDAVAGTVAAESK